MSWNINGWVFQPDSGLQKEFILEVAQKSLAQHNVVINDGQVAQSIQQFTGQVICRSKIDDWDDDRFGDPGFDVRGFARHLHNTSPAGALLHASNEKSVGMHMVYATDDFMDECEKLGRRAVIHNFSVGYPGNIREMDIFKPNFERAYVQGHFWGSHDAYFDRWQHTGPLMRFKYLRDDLMKGRFPEIIFTEGGCCYDYEALRGYRWGPFPLEDEAHGEEVHQQTVRVQEHGISLCTFIISRDFPENRWVQFIPRGAMLKYIYERPVRYQERQKPVACTYLKGRITGSQNVLYNIRSSAVIGDNVVAKLGLNSPVDYCKLDRKEGSGYLWWGVKIGDKDCYVAVKNIAYGNPVCVITPFNEIPDVDLEVPLVMQTGSDADLRKNDCGIACALMAYNYVLKQVGLNNNLVLTVDASIEKSGLASDDESLGVMEIVEFCQDLGMAAAYWDNMTLSEIRRLVDHGVPPIVLVAYKHIFAADAYDWGHYVIVRGYNEEGFFVNDPYQRGANHFVPNTDMQLAITDLGPSASKDYQGIVATSGTLMEALYLIS